jgi:hypothetical protein
MPERPLCKEAQPQYADGPKLFNYRARKNKLLVAKKHPSQHTIEATGLLSSFASANAVTESLDRTERLLRLLIATDPKRHRAAKRKAAKLSRLKRGMVPAVAPQL